jgi:hypothetical protein
MKLLTVILAVSLCLWLFSQVSDGGSETFRLNFSGIPSTPVGKCGCASKLEDGIEVEFHHCDMEQSDISAIKSAKGMHSLILGYLPEGVTLSDMSLLEQLDECDEMRSLHLVINNLKEADLDFIFKLDSLRSLTIHSTYGQELNLTNQFAERLSKLRNLKKLEIGDPGINGEFVGILKSKRDWERLSLDIFHRVQSDSNPSQKKDK